MARMTNRERDVIVDEIYSKVSLPIKEENEQKLKSVKVKRTQYHRDFETYEQLSDRIKVLSDARKALEKKYYRKTYKDYNFSYDPMYSLSGFNKFQAKKQFEFKEVPSKNEIEKQVILAGNKDIPALIEELTLKLKG